MIRIIPLSPPLLYKELHRWTLTWQNGKIFVLRRPDSSVESSQHHIWCSNTRSREVEEERLGHSHSSHGRGVSTTHKMFSNDFPALACFNTSYHARIYGNSDSHPTDNMSAMNEPRYTNIGIHHQLRRDQDATRRSHTLNAWYCESYAQSRTGNCP